jgi:hypothetical protein
MSSSSPSPAFTHRRVLFLTAASVVVLGTVAAFGDVAVVGMAGLSLVMLLALAALALAARELDRDVIYLAGLGALVGATHARLSGGAALAVAGAGETWTVLANTLAGGVVGAAAGDVTRAGARYLPRAALGRKLAGDWWSPRRGPARWLTRLGWAAAALVAAATAVVVLAANAAPVTANYSSELTPNFQKYLEEVETYPGAWRTMGESLLRVWYAYGLLLPALAMCLDLPLRRQFELEADRLLSRIALAHCLTLAFLGGRLLLAALSGLSLLSAGRADSSTPYGDLAALTAAIRDIQPPLIVLLTTVVWLGRWRLHYLRRFGWMPALGAATLAACALAAFGAVFLANSRLGGP